MESFWGYKHLNTDTAATTKVTDEALADLIVDSIQDIKGKNIVKLDLRKLDKAPTNYFIICEGESSTQVKSISQNINRRVREECGIKASHTEGQDDSKWILVDYFTLIVHVFYPETRSYYDLENLWSDAQFTSYEDL